jgi:hypothetical protein
MNESNNRPNMSGDLFPWKFDLTEEVVEIAAHHPKDQSLLVVIRVMYLVGLCASVVVLALFGYSDGWPLVLIAVLIWGLWKLLNEIRFFFAYFKYRKSVCSKWWSRTIINP